MRTNFLVHQVLWAIQVLFSWRDDEAGDRRSASLGLELRSVFDVILDGPMANDLFRGKAGKLLNLDFEPEAPLKHVAKDLDLICDLADESGISVPVASKNRELFATAAESGMGEEDVLAVVKVLVSLTGCIRYQRNLTYSYPRVCHSICGSERRWHPRVLRRRFGPT